MPVSCTEPRAELDAEAGCLECSPGAGDDRDVLDDSDVRVGEGEEAERPWRWAKGHSVDVIDGVDQVMHAGAKADLVEHDSSDAADPGDRAGRGAGEFLATGVATALIGAVLATAASSAGESDETAAMSAQAASVSWNASDGFPAEQKGRSIRYKGSPEHQPLSNLRGGRKVEKEREGLRENSAPARNAGLDTPREDGIDEGVSPALESVVAGGGGDGGGEGVFVSGDFYRTGVVMSDSLPVPPNQDRRFLQVRLRSSFRILSTRRSRASARVWLQGMLGCNESSRVAFFLPTTRCGKCSFVCPESGYCRT